MTAPRIDVPLAAMTFLGAALAGVLASTSILIAAAACAVLVLFLVIAVDRSGVAAFVVSLLFFMASAVSFEQIAVYQDPVRIGGILVLALGAARAGLSATGQGHDRLYAGSPLFAVYLVGMVGYFGAATLPFGDTASLAVGTLGLVMLTAYLLLATKLLTPRTLDVAVVATLASAVAFSLLLGFVLPDVAVVNARLRGISDNANLLGVYAFLLVAAVVLRKRPWPLTVGAIGLGVAALAWTASRASALSLVVALAVGAVMNAGRARQLAIPLLALGAISFAWVSGRAEFAQMKLFRANNSREAGFREVFDMVHAGSYGGMGIGHEQSLIASSPLGAFAHGGVVALCSILLIWVAILWFGWRSGPVTFAFGLSIVVHSIFEAWLLSPIGPMLVLFAMTWISTLPPSGPRVGADRRPSYAAGSGAVAAASARAG